MERPLISILMPVYNAEQFLHEAIESVLNQSFKDFEFLIIDDGSTDRSESIVRSYRDPRIRFYQNEENLGISATLNRGIELAGADLIARMDADDICFPDRLQRQYNFIISHPDGALFSCWAEEITEDKQLIGVERFDPNDYYYNLTFSFWMYHPTLVYRREAVQSIGMYTVPYAEDYELVWQLSRKFRVYPQAEVLLKYRNSGESLWQVTKKQEYREAHLQQVRRNISYYIGSDIQVKDWQIDFLNYNIQPLFKRNDLEEILNCFKLLESITQRVLQKENINRIPEAIKAAAKKKREYTLSLFIPKLGYYKGTILLVRTGSWKLLWRLIVGQLKKMISSKRSD